MLGTIIIREIQEYIKSKKFLIGLFITLVLVTVTTVINIEDYAKRHQDYLDAKREMGKRNVFRPPQVLSILALGKDQKLGNRAEISSMRIDIKTTGYMGRFESMHQKYLSGFSGIDFAFVVRVVLSMLVIFLAYNAISEEKVRGTLKMILSNSLPRGNLILTKCIAGLIIIIFPLITASLVSLVIMVLHPAVYLGNAEWIRIMGMIGVSTLYLTMFYTLSLFISVMVNRPSTALMILLQLWIFLVIIYPNVGVFIADKTYTVTSRGELKRRASRPYYDESNRLLREYIKENPGKNPGSDPDNELLIKRTEAQNKAMEAEYQVEREHSNDLRHQAELAYTIAMFSPAVLYERVMLRYARTGLDDYERFLDGVFLNWKTYRRHTADRQRARETMKNMPEFTYPSETSFESLYASMHDTLILFLFTVIFFLLAYTAFLRKDVR